MQITEGFPQAGSVLLIQDAHMITGVGRSARAHHVEAKEFMANNATAHTIAFVYKRPFIANILDRKTTGNACAPPLPPALFTVKTG